MKKKKVNWAPRFGQQGPAYCLFVLQPWFKLVALPEQKNSQPRFIAGYHNICRPYRYPYF